MPYKDPVKAKAARRASYLRNRDAALERARKYRQEHPEYIEYHRRYYQERWDTKVATLRKSKYGITPERFTQLWTAQDGRCANLQCQRALTSGRGEAGACIDHDHRCCPGAKSCGKCIRGILCGGCNRALGCVGDSANRLSGLIAYLGQPSWQ